MPLPGRKMRLSKPDSDVRLEVRLENETVWLPQQQIANLFEGHRTVIARHINNVFNFKENELDEKSNVQKMHSVNLDK